MFHYEYPRPALTADVVVFRRWPHAHPEALGNAWGLRVSRGRVHALRDWRDVVSKMARAPHVTFAITRNPPHKAALSVDDMVQRAHGWPGTDVLFTDSDPLYIDKARRAPEGTVFIIGVDALIRMLDEKWGYPVDAMLAEFETLGTQFYVSGRGVDGKFVTLADVDTRGFGHLFIEVPGRWDVSSTELRDGAPSE